MTSNSVPAQTVQKQFEVYIRKPYGGQISLGPDWGIENITEFEILTHSWNDAEMPPLKFKFGYYVLNESEAEILSDYEITTKGSLIQNFSAEFTDEPYLKSIIYTENPAYTNNTVAIVAWGQNHLQNIGAAVAYIQVESRPELYNVIDNITRFAEENKNVNHLALSDEDFEQREFDASLLIQALLQQASFYANDSRVFIDTTRACKQLTQFHELIRDNDSLAILEYIDGQLNSSVIQLTLDSGAIMTEILEVCSDLMISVGVAVEEKDTKVETDDGKNSIKKIFKITD